MRQITSLALAALLTLSLAGCGGKSAQTQDLSPEERTALYQNAIEGARDQETNEAVPVVISEDGDMASLILPMLGITAENTTSYAAAVSAMNVRAYGVAAVMPAAGKEEEVRDGLEHFVESQQQSFEQYLADQYEIAKNARLETLADGTLLLVMCPDQDAVFDSIRDTIEAGG